MSRTKYFILSILISVHAFGSLADFYTRDLKIDPLPEAVALVKRTSIGHVVFCSGVLVAPTKVLTAAHCVAYGDGLKYELADLGIHFGQGIEDRELNDSEISDLHRIKSISFHPLYAKTDYRFAHDIAVITLEKSVQNVLPVPLQRELPADSFSIWMGGFGYRENPNTGDFFTEGLKSVFVFENLPFQRFEITQNLRLNELQVVDRANLTGTCKGDSGGPIYILHNDQKFLYALTTTGPMRPYHNPSGDVSYGKCGSDSRGTIILNHWDYLKGELE